jgi:serine/threonine-protein kinase
MGAVYEVVHVNTGEHLALKLMLARSLLSPELVERFRREARIPSSVKSEHIARILDADTAPELDGAPFLVMELLAGKDLERLCGERRPTAAEVVDWLRQVGRTLDKAHGREIVHRDLKPENLFLAEREELSPIIKILDFGIAKVSADAAGQSTASGQILGTPRYMAPEQAGAAKAVGPPVDRFALGLIAFRLLAGRHYFENENWVALLREVAHGPTRRPSDLGCDLGRPFDQWFARACALQPAERFPSCTEQVEALAAAVGIPAQPTSASVALRGGSRTRSTMRWMAFVGTAVGAALLWRSPWPRPVAEASRSRDFSHDAVAVPAPRAEVPAHEVAGTRPPPLSPNALPAARGNDRPPRRRAETQAQPQPKPQPRKDPVWEER